MKIGEFEAFDCSMMKKNQEKLRKMLFLTNIGGNSSGISRRAVERYRVRATLIQVRAARLGVAVHAQPDAVE